jgi:hypothetical protein
MQVVLRNVRHALFAALLSLSTAMAWAQAPPNPPSSVEAQRQSDALLVEEAKRFMDEYAADLRRGDRPAITARYDKTGVYEIRPAQKKFTSHAELVSRYQNQWEKPGLFEWRDLSYEVLAPDKLLVTGLFAWGRSASSSPDVLSYVAILQRQDGELRIRLEAEAWGDGVSLKMLAAAGLFFILGTLIVSWLVRRLIAWRRSTKG